MNKQLDSFEHLAKNFQGELYFNDSVHHRAIIMSYANDASVYQERPVAVAIPANVEDVKKLITVAADNFLSIIPRAAGTSLAGQVVGGGIVVDVSKHFTAVTEINSEEKWVRVQPGVIRDELNARLKPHGLMFGPETSTANRAMVGGMIGNNSCGLHSIIWGDTRQNILELTVLLSDGNGVVLKDLTPPELEKKCRQQDLEGKIYQSLINLLSDPDNVESIRSGFPKRSVHRRNTGYALDILLDQFEKHGSINIGKLIAGSEGTLCFITEAKLKLIDLPPAHKCVVAVHTATINEALRANIIALKHHCSASELVDDVILKYTSTNIDQAKNRFFVQGDPRAILMVEFFADKVDELNAKASAFVEEIKLQSLGFAYPVLFGADTDNAWDLRKAGLGLLRNEPGDTQPVNLIEDCAVDAADLPEYIDDVEALLKRHGRKYSMYAHAGAGELHVEPMINLKTSEGKQLFRIILQETASIVKKYNGSLSGEHGDGRLRGEFIPFMMGEKNYGLFRQVKSIFDPVRVFNMGKIVDTPPMNEFLRYKQDVQRKPISTLFDFSRQENILHLTEKCSGSGDCRKMHISGGTMCPSFMATRRERDTTRARANMLRHYYTSKSAANGTLVSDREVKDVLDLCLSCKGCKSECPSSVDVAKMKAEFTQEYYDKHGVPFRAKLIGNFSSQMRMASAIPWAYNWLFKTTPLRRLINNLVGFHPNRSIPLLEKTTLRKWVEKNGDGIFNRKSDRKVILFVDEFTNYNDVEIGRKMILLLSKLGYNVIIADHGDSGRTYLSKGMVRKAKAIAEKNVTLLSGQVTDDCSVIGIEPSAILTLRDEYPELVSKELVSASKEIARNSFLFEEWFSREVHTGAISSDHFKAENNPVYIHGHCYQKSLSSVKQIVDCFSVLPGCRVTEIPSGCCGMAGSFGYEKEHYDVSMKIGNLVLFPAINKLGDNDIIAASGTSCRHQIKDGTGRRAKHTAEILYEALK